MPIIRIFCSKLSKQPNVIPFNMPPPPLVPTDDISIDELKRQILETEKEFKWRTPNTDVQIDSQEFLAFQEIPLFGAHFYYAYSPNERVQRWKNFNKFASQKEIAVVNQMQEISDQIIETNLMTQEPQPKSKPQSKLKKRGQ